MSTTGPAAGSTTHELHRSFSRDTSQLADVRRFVRSWFEQHDVSPTVVDDFELAVSELATNATQHGAGASIDIVLAVDEQSISAVVAADSDQAGRIGSVDSWHIAPASAVNGRGLGIVAAVMDVVEFSGDAGRAVFRCRQFR
jgi:anti-sigma regulatory factor (Ser/Thr protein kinase)